MVFYSFLVHYCVLLHIIAQNYIFFRRKQTKDQNARNNLLFSGFFVGYLFNFFSFFGFLYSLLAAIVIFFYFCSENAYLSLKS